MGMRGAVMRKRQRCRGGCAGSGETGRLAVRVRKPQKSDCGRCGKLRGARLTAPLARPLPAAPRPRGRAPDQ